jgi:hypothetical protein
MANENGLYRLLSVMNRMRIGKKSFLLILGLDYKIGEKEYPLFVNGTGAVFTTLYFLRNL